MKAACSQLSAFEAEVGRLTASQALSEEQWTSRTSHLQQELDQATAQKVQVPGTWRRQLLVLRGDKLQQSAVSASQELLRERVEILQGKISSLEEQLSRASQVEVGENMGPVMEVGPAQRISLNLNVERGDHGRSPAVCLSDGDVRG